MYVYVCPTRLLFGFRYSVYDVYIHSNSLCMNNTLSMSLLACVSCEIYDVIGQVTIEVLNKALDTINSHLYKTSVTESISQNDLHKLLLAVLPEEKIKSVVMAIVNMKRLDIVSDRGVKHYKVKHLE